MTLGRVMAGVHKLAMPDWGEAELQSKPPWILSISRPEMGALSEFSMGQLRIIAILQRFPDFGLAFDELRRGWRNTALIHYDIKWDNVLIARRGRRPNAMIIDWELAGPGDPCWDIGSELSSYLNGWLGSIPATRDTPPERLVELARHPLTGMQPSMAAFWDAYAGSMGIAPDAVGSWKVRSVRYAAARLVQTVYERMQSSSHLSGNDVCALQVSLNMLRRPEEALVRLLGIPL
jgi:hypothetical protein